MQVKNVCRQDLKMQRHLQCQSLVVLKILSRSLIINQRSIALMLKSSEVSMMIAPMRNPESSKKTAKVDKIIKTIEFGVCLDGAVKKGCVKYKTNLV